MSLGGGILQKLQGQFDETAFRARFIDKGRFRPYLEGIPTYRVHAAEPALLRLAKTVGQSRRTW